MSCHQKQILIYLDKNLLAPIGGPIGYNYNLYKQLKEKDVNNIHYIESGRENIEKWKNKVSSIKNDNLRKAATVLKKVYKHGYLLYGGKHNAVVDLNQYDIVHFHSTLDMYSCRDSLRDYKGTVVLTSHSPTLLSKEIYDGASFFEKYICAFIYKNLIKLDEYSFNRADVIIFPCPEAEEPYEHAWGKFKAFKQENKDKFKYLLTGIDKCSAKVSRDVIREKYHIPKNAFLVCFVGRHNQIKGYDRLKQIAKEILEKNDDIYFIIAGREKPLTGLSSDHWIEVGWTKDPHSIISASDIFILPNRETYFDLVLLEVMSLGKIIVASNTGGNKYFKDSPSSIMLFNNEQECIDKILELKMMSKDQLEELEKESIKCFEKYFTSEIFCDNYINLINSL